jgi:hypothetical protein
MAADTGNKRHRRPFGPNRQGGSVLIVVVSLLLVMSVLIGFMLDLSTTSLFGELTYNQMERAFFMAEAGGHYACPLVKQDIESDATYDDTYSLHNQTFTLDDGGTQDGQFTISVDDSDPASTLVYSTGLVGTGIYLDAQVTLTYSMAKTVAAASPFDKALFAGRSLWLGWNVKVNGDVGTNATHIWDLFGADISGTTETSASRTLDQIPFSCSGCSGDLEINGSVTWSEGTYEYENVTLKKNNTLTISGDVVLYVESDFVTEQGTSITILPDSSLTIYVDGSAEFGKNSFSNQGGSPEDLVIYGASNADTITFDQGSLFIGAVYAPGADILLGKNMQYTGAVIGDKVTMVRGSMITYNSDVLNITAPVSGGSVVIDTPIQYFSN